jgi:hypothetical protein
MSVQTKTIHDITELPTCWLRIFGTVGAAQRYAVENGIPVVYEYVNQIKHAIYYVEAR